MFVLFRYDRNWAGGEAEVKRAIELNPNYGTAYQVYATYLLATERPDEALDPNAAVHGYMALAYQEKGMFDEAFTETLKMRAPKWSAEQMEELRQAYATSGYTGLVTTEIKLLKERSKGQYESAAELARLCAMIGQKDEAFEWLKGV